MLPHTTANDGDEQDNVCGACGDHRPCDCTMATHPSDADYMEAARRLFHKDGEVEIDALAKVSRHDDTEGAYVEAWVWVPADQVRAAEHGGY